MKRSDRTIIAILALGALLVGFWLLVLGPKRNRAADLAHQADTLRTQLAQDRQTATLAQSAHASFAPYYRRVIVLGKAVPADSDTPSLLVEVQRIAHDSHVQFLTMDLAASTSSSAPAAAPPAVSSTPAAPSAGSTATTPTGSTPPPASGSTPTATPTSGSAPASGTTAPPPATSATGSTPTGSTSTAVPSTSTATPAAPTESAAALLPLGASVGPAGLPVMSYTMTFRGGFFQIADFLRGVDKLVHMHHGRLAVSGRLITVDGFSLTDDTTKHHPVLAADLSVTTYLTPPDQGITAGATPAGPAPASAVPVSSTSSTPGGIPPAGPTTAAPPTASNTATPAP